MDLVAQMKGSSPPLLWDGGIGTELIARGLDLALEPPESWLTSHPETVRAVHADFAAAGADVVQTNTFGLPRLTLAAWQPGSGASTAADLVPLAVRLAREGAQAGGQHVVASLGPSGLMDPDPGQIRATYTRLAESFAAQGIRVIHLETFYLAEELRAALAGVRAGDPAVQVICSITLNLGNGGLETPMGTPLAYMLRVMEQEAPEAIGVNCSMHARRMLPAVEALADWARGRVPILAQPQVDRNGPECKWRTRAESEGQFVQGLQRLLEAGATAVGGCCGCSPDYLRALRAALGPARPRTPAQAQ